MVYGNRKESDDLLQILSAYRFPTIIMSAGFIVAILGFLLALRYDINQSQQSFRDIAQQVNRTIMTEVRRHEQLVTSVASMLGRVRDLTGEEFGDIAGAFSRTSHFTSFYLYSFNKADGPVRLSADGISTEDGSIAEIFSSADADEKIENMAGLPEIRSAIKKADVLGKIFFSGAYQFSQDSGPDYAAVVVAPVSDRYKKHIFLVGVLDLDSLLDASLKMFDQEINVRVYDVADQEKILFYEAVEPQGRKFFTDKSRENYSILSFQGRHLFEGHSWDIRIFSSLSNLTRTIGLLPWVVFISTLILTGLLSYIVFRITTENLKATALVERQTKNLRQYAEKLEMSNRDLDDFAHIASHDLKEPLRGLYNYAEFLKEDYEDKLDDAGREKLETLKRLARRMESLIESLLDYSRLSRIDLAFRKTDLNQVVDDVLVTLTPWLEQNKARILVKGPLPTVKCDSVKVSEVFRNLVTNAVKYNNKPDRVVEIGSIRSQDSEIPVFYVRDNGIGISEENRSQIFKIFRRLHAREEYGGGTGVGLTIVWKIIQRHGGKIWVESILDERTTFFFTLDRSDDDAG